MSGIWNKYGPTAARKHGKPGRELRPKTTTVDIHAHVAVPAAGAFVRPHLDLSKIPLTHFATADNDDFHGLSFLNHSSVSSRPSRMPIVGSKPRTDRANAISGDRNRIGTCRRGTCFISPRP